MYSPASFSCEIMETKENANNKNDIITKNDGRSYICQSVLDDKHLCSRVYYGIDRSKSNDLNRYKYKPIDNPFF